MAKARRLKPPEIEEIFRRFHEIEPEPKGELTSVNEFTFLVAVVLSAQATDVGVNRATAALFKVVDTPEKMLALGEEGLRELHQIHRPLPCQGQKRDGALKNTSREACRLGSS